MSKDVLFEIGLEELPARFIDDAEKQLINKTKNWLTETRLPYKSITSYSTPRRLGILIHDVAEEQTTIKEEVRGPAEKIAKDEEGNWTKAAIGFSKGQGLSVDDIYLKEINGTPYIFVEKNIIGKQTKDILSLFNSVIESITFPEQMVWGVEKLRYARPIRWLVALYGEQIIPFEVASVKTDNKTFGHRFLGEKIELKNPAMYEQELRNNYVIPNKLEREEIILSSIKEIELQNDFKIIIDPNLLSEVCNLIEYPTVFTGEFQASFLNLPREALITSMQEHQRYFPVESNKNELLPYFIGVRNGNDYELENVVSGNEKVLRARLSDGEFFYNEDLSQSIEENIVKLDRVVFQEKMGTVSDKVARVVKITEELTEKIDLDMEQANNALRAAEISKFDLVTQMVNEFPELQGVMGEKYALHFGEDLAVGKAIREQYLPKQANGLLPESTVGALVSVADKIDTIVGCISVGLIPTGSQDPYGLRRQAIGIVRIISDQKWDLTIEALIELGMKHFQTETDNKQEVLEKLTSFFSMRVAYLLKEKAIDQDIIKAVLQKEIGYFSYTQKKAEILSSKRQDESFKFVQEALVRAMNLGLKSKANQVNESLFQTSSERKLYSEYNLVCEEFITKDNNKDAAGALSQLERLAKPIHEFFDHNMVMTDEQAIQDNRLALLNKISEIVKSFADLTIIEWNR